MTLKLPSLLATAAILALAPTAEPVTLDDAQLDEVIEGSNPGTSVDDIIWDYGGDDVYGASAGSSLSKLSSGSRIVKASDEP